MASVSANGLIGDSLDNDWSRLVDVVSFAARSDYQEYLNEYHESCAERWRAGQQLAALCRNHGCLPGWCSLCEKPDCFRFNAEPGSVPNLREELSCACGLNARVRFALHLLKGMRSEASRPDIYITEQLSFAYLWLKKRFSRVIGSEYFSKEQQRELTRRLHDLGLGDDQLRFEDVTRLSMDDASLDVVLSFDVLEHVPDYRAALGEFARCLRPEGVLILTVPFLSNADDTVVRARVGADGRIEHLLEPEYHGDTINSQGVLAYYNFGWDFLEQVREAGFETAAWCIPWSLGLGMPGDLWTLIAIRSESSLSPATD